MYKYNINIRRRDRNKLGKGSTMVKATCKLCANCKYLGILSISTLDIGLKRCEFWGEEIMPQGICKEWQQGELGNEVVVEMLEFQKNKLVKEIDKLNTLIKDLIGESK